MESDSLKAVAKAALDTLTMLTAGVVIRPACTGRPGQKHPEPAAIETVAPDAQGGAAEPVPKDDGPDAPHAQPTKISTSSAINFIANDVQDVAAELAEIDRLAQAFQQAGYEVHAGRRGDFLVCRDDVCTHCMDSDTLREQAKKMGVRP